MANTLILSKLWHIIRVVSLPQDILKKVKSIIHQFVMSGLFPPLKVDNNGFLSDFTYQLLTNALGLTNDAVHHALPSLFKSARYKNTLNGLHPFLPMFNVIDTCSSHSSWSSRPSVGTIMSLPLLAIFKPFDNTIDLDFMHKESVRESCVRDFFDYDLATHHLQFKPRSTCSKPHTLTRVRRALNNHQISFQSFVHNNSASDLDYQPFVTFLVYQQQQIMKLPNRELRFVILDMPNLDVGKHFSGQLSKQQWKAFYKNNMHYSARNLWYRMIHKQSSNKLAMYQRQLKHVESDRYELCNEVEDAKHLLISCAHKLDVWDSSFNEFLGYPKVADSHSTYKSIMLFNLDRYFIYNLDIHITIYDFFATIMHTIWRHHYQQLYDYIPFNSNQVRHHTRTELLRLSNLKRLHH